MPIKKKGKGKGLKKKGAKGAFVLKSPKTGKVLAQGSKKQVTKRAAAIAGFRAHGGKW
jgi:hypothetical protein